ncbi:MAG: SDR family oxidoreductase [Deltaproteobacteria bacterium]|nr:SDR family oxidoreductase [Deltaproteobacteria bacterium]MBW2538576.1 SDR family oxidoreductase [Deltaproteobacteria bacterium]
MNLLILGANSEIAYAIGKKFVHYEKANLYLASRDIELLQKKVKDIQVRSNVNAQALFFDALDYTSHQSFYSGLGIQPDGVVLAFGYFGDQKEAQQDFKKARHIIEANFTGAASILEVIATDFEQRQQGFIIGISSVAGDRGRQSNYIYGSAKGALTIYLAGLRNRLHKSNVQVITVLPGYARTKMTAQMELPEILLAEPDEVAEDVYNAYRKGKDIIYTKWFWRVIMFLIKITPEKIFKRLQM